MCRVIGKMHFFEESHNGDVDSPQLIDGCDVINNKQTIVTLTTQLLLDTAWI